MKQYIALAIYFIGSVLVAQDNPSQATLVDFTKIEATVTPSFETKTITGDITATFTMVIDAPSIFLDAKKMEIARADDKLNLVPFDNRIMIEGDLKAGRSYTISFSYKATPKQTLYFVNDNGKPQIWTQGQGKYTSHWLPSIDDMNDKIEFDLSVIAPEGQTVIANGQLKEKKYIGETEKKLKWQYDMQQPMSSYLVAMVIGDFEKTTFDSASGVPMEIYATPKDSSKAEATYRHTQKIFDFFEQKIGVDYPWQNYKQVPVKDFLYAGMENTGTTVFADNFIIDEIGFVDRNYINVNAHELAHQWFGNLVTETNSEHHWLHEGFASYYALLAEREIFGQEYYYFKLYQSAENLKELSDTGKGQKLVNPKASSLTYYEKGAWALHILNELIGEDAFNLAVKNYLTKHQFGNVTTSDFMTEIAQVTEKDLTEFKKDWLQQSAFQDFEALTSLRKNDFMNTYFELVALRQAPFKNKAKKLRQYIYGGNQHLGQEAVYQLSGHSLQETLPLYIEAFSSQNIYTRQAVATSLEQIPQALLANFKTLLDDNSYITQEEALLKLWLHFSNLNDAQATKEKHQALDKVAPVFGFSDGNVRTLWLALALASPDYRVGDKLDLYNELKGYTVASKPFQLRQNAFQYLYQVQLFDRVSITNLLEACVHHNWRFRQSSRSLLDKVIQNPDWKTTIDDLKPSLPEKQLTYLKRLE